MVGRSRQLKLLNDAFDNVVSSRTCQLFTVLGSAGVGKTRLVYEFLRSLGDVKVVQGRCLSYGEGITYWPVVEVVKQLGGAEALSDETPRHALRVVLGEVDVAAATPDQIAWAFRKLVETSCRGRAAHLSVRRHPVGGSRLPRARRARCGSLEALRSCFSAWLVQSFSIGARTGQGAS